MTINGRATDVTTWQNPVAFVASAAILFAIAYVLFSSTQWVAAFGLGSWWFATCYACEFGRRRQRGTGGWFSN